MMRENKQTALVTGPTSGIGEQIAEQLAQDGYDLVLVSRRKETLIRISAELTARYPVKAHYIVADLSKPGEAERVFGETQSLGIEVDLLVNNAGSHVYAPFPEVDWEALETLIDLNVRATVRLTHLYLPGMLARERGHILNLGSTGSFVPWPNDAVYGAGKAFVLSFSQAIAEELRGTPVGVTCLCPGVVATPFIENGGLSSTILARFTAIKPDLVADAGLRAMQQGKWVHVVGLVNKLIVFLKRFAPRRFLTRLAKWATLPPGYH